MRCAVPVARTRRLIGLLTLLTLVAIAIGITGFEPPMPRFGGSSDRPLLPGVRAASASVLLRIAPTGGELAFFAVEPSGNLVVTDAKRRTVMRFDLGGQLVTDSGPTF